MTELTRGGAQALAHRLLGRNAMAIINKTAMTPNERVQAQQQLRILRSVIDEARARSDKDAEVRAEQTSAHLTEQMRTPRYVIALREQGENGARVVQPIGAGNTWQEAFNAALANVGNTDAIAQVNAMLTGEG